MIKFVVSPEGVRYEYPDIPLFEAVDGIKYDFLNGLRILIPKDGKPYNITFWDEDTGTVLFAQQICQPGSLVRSVKTYYIRFHVQISDVESGAVVWDYTLDLRNKPVMLLMNVSTIGDTMAWFPYADLFRIKHGCHVICVMKDKFSDILKRQYPHIQFANVELAEKIEAFAAYMLGLWWGGNTNNQPFDHRLTGLHKQAANILGLSSKNEYRPRFDLSAPRQIKEHYVCIACQSTTMCKNWLNPFGWDQVVNFLKENGYRVLCIDRDEIQGIGGVYNRMPQGVENFTGDLPLQERINVLKDADFFVGLPSGLSWLAWGCDIPVVMISGFSLPYTEFYTPYRVINFNTCNGCWNDVRYDFDHHDWLWCPRHKGTKQQYECSVLISAQQVIETIKRIPAFQRRNTK